MSEQIGVLLPLQLETKFVRVDDPDDPDRRWLLQLRVIPQPPSIDGHNTHITDEELRAVTLFRRSLGLPGVLGAWLGSQPAHRDAFAVLARSVGPARAAWLAENTTADSRAGGLVAQRGPATPAEDGPQCVRGLPARLLVGAWTYDQEGHELVEVIGSLPEDPQASISPELALPLLASHEQDPNAARPAFFDHWLVDWPAARAAGLGGEFLLPAGLDPQSLGGLCVWGVGDEPPAPLFESQIWVGALAEVALGTSTNTVAGESTATSPASPSGQPVPDGAPDEESFWLTLLHRLDPQAHPPTSLDRLVSQYLTGSAPPSIARARTRDTLLPPSEPTHPLTEVFTPDELIDAAKTRATNPHETALAPLLMHALWPVLWGSFARDEWQLDALHHPDTVGELSRWALDHVNPEGPLPPVRFADEPYALLPITRLDTRVGQPGDAPGLEALRTSLQMIRNELHASLVMRGTVRGADHESYARLLGRGGSSRSFGTRLNGSIAYLTDPPRWPTVDECADARATSLHRLGLPDPLGHPFLSLTGTPNAIGLPLVSPTRWTFWRGDRQYRRVPLPALIATALRLPLHPMNPGNHPYPASFHELFHAAGSYDVQKLGMEGHLGMPPDSLLARLLLQSVLTVNSWRDPGDPDADPTRQLGPGYSGAGWALSVLQTAMLVDPGRDDPDYDWLNPATWDSLPEALVASPGGELPVFTQPSVSGTARAQLERAVGAVLDTFSTRIDPWITGFAWQRLRRATADPDTQRRLGAYGWVHGPFDGVPGPTDSGLLHTPSQGQTLVATLARDNFREYQRTGVVNDHGETPWGLALTGSANRIAYDLIADLRDGHHLWEIMGRRVEDIVTAPAPSPYQAAVWLRRTYPMYPERPDPRQVCDGTRALAGLLAGDVVPDVGPPSADQRVQLQQLQAGMDVLADLTLLDGALYSASRMPGRAAAAMNGASGTGAIPEPEFPRTPTSGREVRSVVLSVLPWRQASPGDVAARLAEPSVAAFLDDHLQDGWAWQVKFEDGNERNVALTELGLRPIDCLALSADVLRSLVAVRAGVRGGPASHSGPDPSHAFAAPVSEAPNRSWQIITEGGIGGIVTLASLGIAPSAAAELPEADLRQLVLSNFFGDAPVPDDAALQVVPSDHERVWTVQDQLGNVLGVYDAGSLGLTDDESSPPLEQLAPRLQQAAGAPAASVTDPPALARLARLCAVLGAPATERDLQPDTDAIKAPAAWAELRDRYLALYQDLQDAISLLSIAAKEDTRDADRVSALQRAALWGAVPDTTPADSAGFAAALTGTVAPPGATPPRALALLCADILSARLEAATPHSDLPSVKAHDRPIDGYAELRDAAVPDGVASMARAISSLAAPQGNLPILTCWDRGKLTTAAPLDKRDRVALEEGWLTVVAPVRPALARLEAVLLQAELGGEPSLTVWATTADPWRTDEIAAQEAASSSHKLFGFSLPPLVLGFGPAAALDETRLAVGLLDSFTEVVPLRRRDTHAAFGFNAPLARAPQAILLAVPPNPDEPLTNEDIAVMLTELRETVVARSATAQDLEPYRAVVGTIWLPRDDTVSILDPNAYSVPI